MSSTKVRRNLVVFDFDHSFADVDCEYWIFEVLAPELRFEMDLMDRSGQWNEIAEECFLLLGKAGVTRKQIEENIINAPVVSGVLPLPSPFSALSHRSTSNLHSQHPAMIRAVRALKARKDQDTTFMLLSNANTVLIGLILARHGLSDFFEEIITNPAVWEGDTLVMSPRVDPKGPQHTCKVPCNRNMCKGEELDNYVKKHGGWESFDRVSYVGDGYNDLCPVLTLREQDWALVRSGRTLAPLIIAQGVKRGLRAQLKFWGEAWELERIFNAF